MTPENEPLAFTTGYGIQIAHTRTEGLAVNPVAGPSPQHASLVRLHAPFELASVFWNVCSQGKPPILPSPKSYLTNYNRVFLGGERVGIVTPAAIGHFWVAAGRYDFSVQSPEGLDSNFFLAKCPWETQDSSFYAYIPAENFQLGLLDATLNPGSGGLGLDPDVPIVLQQMLRG